MAADSARKWSDDHYRAVAAVYMAALKTTHRTDMAVAETWQVPHTTAAGWIKRARQLGFLSAPWTRCSGRCPVHCPPDG